MNALIRAWADFVLAKRAGVLVAVALFLALALLTGPPIPFDNSTERYFVAGDPTLAEYDRLLELFGDNEYLVVGFEASGNANDVFSADTLNDLVKVTEFLEFHPAITQVRSLSNYQYIHADGDTLNIDYLFEDATALAQDPAAIARAKEILNEENLALGVLITEDFRHTRIAARVEYREGASPHKIELVQELYQFVEDESIASDDYLLHLSGYPLVNERYETVSAEDLDILIPIMVALMVAMLFLSFRSLVGTLFPWVVIAGGIVVVTEIQSYLQLPHSTVDSALLPTLIIIGIGSAVHVLVEYFHHRHLGLNGVEAAHASIIHIWRPALFTALTTSAGFYALSVTRILPVRDFALLGAIGPIALFVFALTVLPALLSYVKKLPAHTHDILDDGYISKLTQRVPAYTLKHRNIILACGALMLIFSFIYIPTIKIDTNYVTLFKESSKTRQDIHYFDEVFKGTMTLDIILDSGAVDGVKNPAFLAKIEAIESWLEMRDPLGQINSLADYLKEISQALNGDDPDFYKLPDTAEMAAQFLLLYDSAGPNEDLSDIKDFEDRYARLNIPLVNMVASETKAELDAVTEFMTSNYSDLNPLLTGTMVLFTVQDIYTSEGMFASFLIALGVICGFFIVLFRSFKWGILCMIPSVLPIILTASFASMLGIYLDLSMLIVGAMTMGIAVDDSIHVMTRYLMSRKAGASTQQAIARAMRESGRAVVFSSLVLVLGFSVLCFGSFTTVIYVGLFGSIIMSLALLGDLLFLPALLYLVDGKDKETDLAVSENAPSTAATL